MHVLGGLLLFGYAQEYYFHLRKWITQAALVRGEVLMLSRSPQEQRALEVWGGRVEAARRQRGMVECESSSCVYKQGSSTSTSDKQGLWPASLFQAGNSYEVVPPFHRASLEM